MGVDPRPERIVPPETVY
jgi:hypothetical protein